MNKISELFKTKDKKVLSIYFTAGFPELQDTEVILESLVKHGADMIEIGMPYSDPLADGPVIQHSSMVALNNGMTIPDLFRQLKSFKENNNKIIHNVPLILMGYLNPVLQFGFKDFCEAAAKVNIDGLILPDLPIAEYERDYKKILEEHNLSMIFLVTPETSDERIRKIDDITNGFIYAVSSTSITGSDTDMRAQETYFERLQNMNLKNKVLIGFGIRDHKSFAQACHHASGAIIGTAYINVLGNNSDIDEGTKSFIQSIIK